jgi:antitoxin component YwqK of YwqJK toxin-antitoxin module
MRPLFFILLFILPLSISAQTINYGFPVFNREIKKTLRDSGAYDKSGFPDGLWIEYKIDSAETKNFIQAKDNSYSFFPPYNVVILKTVAYYSHGYRQGEWKTYKSYSYAPPYKWDLQEVVSYKKSQLSGWWRYYSSSGKIITEAFYKHGHQTVYKKYYPNGKLQQVIPMKNDIPNGIEKTYNTKGVLVSDAKIVDGYYQGSAHFYYSNGKLSCSRIYKDGSIWEEKEVNDRYGNPLEKGTLNQGTGSVIFYNEIGGRISVFEYYQGHLNGKAIEYFPNGKPMRELPYVNDEINGVEKVYYETGKLNWESTIKKNIYDGDMKLYYPNGKLWVERTMKDGVIWNIISLFDTTGKPLDFGTFKNGNGLLKYYSDSCVLVSSYEYKDGKKHGKGTGYFPNGKISFENTWVDGIIEGIEKQYFKNGKLFEEITYEKGSLNGNVKVYHFNGKLFYEEYFVNDLLWNIISIADTSGHPLDQGTFKDGTGTIKTYSDSGTYYGIRSVVCGHNQGKAELYYPSGKLKSKLNYANDTLDGDQIHYYENGNVKIIEPYINGIMDGTSIAYHNNGVLWTKREYVNGLLFNVEMNNDRNGQPRDKGTIKDGNGTMIRYDENEKIMFAYQIENGILVEVPNDPEW